VHRTQNILISYKTEASDSVPLSFHIFSFNNSEYSEPKNMDIATGGMGACRMPSPVVVGSFFHWSIDWVVN